MFDRSTQKVTISKKAKRISLQRYLASKIVYESNKFGLRHLYGLFINQLWLEGKASADPNFREKFGGDLESLSYILKEINFSRGFNPSSLTRLKSKLLKNIPDFIVPQRNFAAWKSKFDSSVVISYQEQLGTPNQQLPPEQYIGKGYGDKGTAKKPELDGSPSWQDVASSERLRVQEENRRNTRDKFSKINSIDKLIFEIKRAVKIEPEE